MTGSETAASAPLRTLPGRLILLAGPTAVGKSEVALELAGRLGGEILSVDSMQVYRGLDIGTAKPSAEDRRRVRHHLVDVAELTEPFDAARFVRLARAAVEEIRGRGAVPILCGGTGLYFKAFLEGLGEAPPADPALRTELEQIPLVALLQELAERDPATFARIDRRNPRRVLRALEVIRLTGRPFSEQRASWQRPPEGGAGPFPFFGLTRASGDLGARIEGRVEAMFRRGLVTETERLLERGLAGNQTALQAIGYRQVVEHLRGLRPLAETIELVKIRTRQFARRQRTWFRHQAGLQWLQVPAAEPAAVTASRLAEALGRGG